METQDELTFTQWLIKSSQEHLLRYEVEAETAREQQILKEDRRIAEALATLDAEDR